MKTTELEESLRPTSNRFSSKNFNLRNFLFDIRYSILAKLFPRCRYDYAKLKVVERVVFAN